MLLLLFMQTVTGSTAETLVLSCDECHGQASCLESPVRRERGDTFTSQAFSCVCKDGFVGDGLACYSAKLCSDSSCCHQGYRWSPENGCVDVDECSLPDPPCTHPQLCQNTPGSFECLVPPSNARSSHDSGTDPRSVQFHCGGMPCPLGTDCTRVNGTLLCVDPCEHYTVLDDAWRATDNRLNGVPHCDQQVNWQGWYRLFLGQTSAHIPESCVDKYMCGTDAPLWIRDPHPTHSDEIVQRSVCGHWNGDCCYFPSTPIHVKYCYGNYYVYKLVMPDYCSLAYCAEVKRPPLQASQLVCGRDQLQIGLRLASLASSDLNALSGHLADRHCSDFSVRDRTVWYQVVRRAGICGNTLRTNSTHAIYSNNLFVYPVNNVSLALPVSVPFSCAYPLDTETSLDVAVRPYLVLAGGISGSGTKARASMSLFRTSSYTEPYPAGQVSLPVGSALHVGVSVGESDPSFVVVLEDCYATHSSNPDDPMRYSLIQNKCPSDRRQVTVDESGSSRRARFSALLFLLESDYRDVFLHCSLSLCDRRSSSCTPVCSRRAYRSVSTSAPIKPLTIGPITWKNPLE
ncbi:uromodulin [Centroberyx gerrardi]